MSRSTFAKFFDTHYSWEDWLGIALGVVILLSPMASTLPLGEGALVNALIVGSLVVALAALELVDLRRGEEWALLVLGAWLAASPHVFGYTADSVLASWHFWLGLATLALAALEYWQDRDKSQDDLARHGR